MHKLILIYRQSLLF